jgi:hypothetical protein
VHNLWGQSKNCQPLPFGAAELGKFRGEASNGLGLGEHLISGSVNLFLEATQRLLRLLQAVLGAIAVTVMAGSPTNLANQSKCRR